MVFLGTNEALREIIKLAIQFTRKIEENIGLFCQALNEYPEFTTSLFKEGFDIILFNLYALL